MLSIYLLPFILKWRKKVSSIFLFQNPKRVLQKGQCRMYIAGQFPMHIAVCCDTWICRETSTPLYRHRGLGNTQNQSLKKFRVCFVFVYKTKLMILSLRGALPAFLSCGCARACESESACFWACNIYIMNHTALTLTLFHSSRTPSKNTYKAMATLDQHGGLGRLSRWSVKSHENRSLSISLSPSLPPSHLCNIQH